MSPQIKGWVTHTPCRRSLGRLLLCSAQAFYTTCSNAGIQNSPWMPRTFLQAVSQGLNLAWMRLRDGPSPPPELCLVDAYSFFETGVAAVPVREAGGREGCSHGLLSRGCATWWAHPWGRPSEGMKPTGTDARGSFVACTVLFGVVFHGTRQTYFGQYVGFTQHKDCCAETQASAMLPLGGPSVKWDGNTSIRCCQ